LTDGFKRAWQIREQNFEPVISFFAPAIKKYETEDFSNEHFPLFTPVSVTGSSCALNCPHCQKKILETMPAVKNPSELYELGKQVYKQGGSGLLISGGADRKGTVPLLPYAETMKKLKNDFNLKITVHTGLVNSILARALKEAEIDGAMIDIIGSNETIKKIYNLPATVEQYEESLSFLVGNGIKTSPHLVIGLHFGKIRGELKALEMISRYQIASLVLVVIFPLSQTPMEGIELPPLQEVVQIFIQAREIFPRTPLLLGCARPGGEYRAELDKAALKAGFNGLAYPSEGMITLSQKYGLKIVFSETCCSLIEGVKNGHL
jgi:hypothetical protein